MSAGRERPRSEETVHALLHAQRPGLSLRLVRRSVVVRDKQTAFAAQQVGHQHQVAEYGLGAVVAVYEDQVEALAPRGQDASPRFDWVRARVRKRPR